TSSRSAGLAGALLPAGMALLLFLQLLQMLFQTIEALLPEIAVVFQPVDGVLERISRKAARPPLRLAATHNQASALQHLKVLGDCGKAHREWFGERGDRSLARGQASQDRAPCRIGQGCEGGGQTIGQHPRSTIW